MTEFKPINNTVLEELSKILAEEATGSELSRLFLQIKIHENSANTKWKRIYNVLSTCQQHDKSSSRVFRFIQIVLDPARYATNEKNNSRYKEALTKINIQLSFIGYKINPSNQIISIDPAKNLDEALKQAQNFYKTLLDRHVHGEVLKYCKPETLQENYFHAVFEAVKGVCVRIRELTGLESDGVQLIETAFSNKNPYLAINTLQTSSEKNEHNGFRYLLCGIITMVRNPLAHEAKINWNISGEDGLDILTTLSFIHRTLDRAVLIRHDQ